MSTGNEDFKTVVVLRGVYGGSPIALAVDSSGRLRVQAIGQTSITPDLLELTSWSSPPADLLANLNNIRHEICAITGLAWGHAVPITGITHHGDLSGLSDDDHPQYALVGAIDHGALTGLSDYDHDQYVRKNLSQALTGAVLYRDVDSSLLQMHGGINAGGSGANIRLYGANTVGFLGSMYFSVPNAAKNADLIVFYVEGDTDNPVLNFNARRLTNIADPTDAYDAINKHYLTSLNLLQSYVSPDAVEAQTWDVPIVSLLNNLNRIRQQIINLSGEVWGTVTTSTKSLFAKFHATTGHKHTGATSDAPILHHGDLSGLTDDDHARYYDKDTSKAVTGAAFFRDLDTSLLEIKGGSNAGGKGAGMRFYGSSNVDSPGSMYFSVPNAAKNGDLVVFYIDGNTDTPLINFNSRRLVAIADPVNDQDVVSKAWHNANTFALPSQTGKAGKYLNTDGSTPAWSDVYQFFHAASGSTLRAVDNNLKITYTTSWVKMMAIKVPVNYNPGSVFHITFYIGTANAPYVTTARVYNNGTPVGQQWQTSVIGWMFCEEDITLAFGGGYDIEIWMIAYSAGVPGYLNNLALYCENIPEAPAWNITL